MQLNLTNKKDPSATTTVISVAHARVILSRYLQETGIGASDMLKGFGEITNVLGIVGRVHYNGSFTVGVGSAFDASDLKKVNCEFL
jgi:hypothetical protein